MSMQDREPVDTPVDGDGFGVMDVAKGVATGLAAGYGGHLVVKATRGLSNAGAKRRMFAIAEQRSKVGKKGGALEAVSKLRSEYVTARQFSHNEFPLKQTIQNRRVAEAVRRVQEQAQKVAEASRGVDEAANQHLALLERLPAARAEARSRARVALHDANAPYRNLLAEFQRTGIIPPERILQLRGAMRKNIPGPLDAWRAETARIDDQVARSAESVRTAQLKRAGERKLGAELDEVVSEREREMADLVSKRDAIYALEPGGPDRLPAKLLMESPELVQDLIMYQDFRREYLKDHRPGPWRYRKPSPKRVEAEMGQKGWRGLWGKTKARIGGMFDFVDHYMVPFAGVDPNHKGWSRFGKLLTSSVGGVYAAAAMKEKAELDANRARVEAAAAMRDADYLSRLKSVADAEVNVADGFSRNYGAVGGLVNAMASNWRLAKMAGGSGTPEGASRSGKAEAILNSVTDGDAYNIGFRSWTDADSAQRERWAGFLGIAPTDPIYKASDERVRAFGRAYLSETALLRASGQSGPVDLGTSRREDAR